MTLIETVVFVVLGVPIIILVLAFVILAVWMQDEEKRREQEQKALQMRSVPIRDRALVPAETEPVRVRRRCANSSLHHAA